MLSIHNNLSAGTQNVTGAYACLQALVNNAPTWQRQRAYMAKQLCDSK